jgi:flagellar protein FlaJ
LKDLNTYLEYYKMFCYHLGRYIDRKPRDNIAGLLHQSDLVMTPGMLISLAGVTAIIAAGVMFVASTLLFITSNSPLIYVMILTTLTFALTLGGFPFIIYTRISDKKMEIEQELPYVIGYMSVLASAGSSPIDVIRRISIENYGHISKEFGKVIYRVDILGEDAATAMNDLIRNSSSEIFRVFCIDLANIIYSGSGFMDYLEIKSKDMMMLRRLVQKEFVDSLSVYGEAYLGGVVMSIVLAILGIVVTGALGIEVGLFKPQDLFNIFIYFVLPFVNILFLALLWTKYSRSPV